MRFDNNSVNANSQRKYIGENYDADTALSYLNARYYDGSRGEFLSMDPSFLSIGSDQQLKQNTGMELLQYLSDPQGMNSYSYARNNPLTYSDPEGKFIQVGVLIILGGFTLAVSNSAPHFFQALQLSAEHASREEIAAELRQTSMALYQFPVGYAIPESLSSVLDIKGYIEKFKEIFDSRKKSDKDKESDEGATVSSGGASGNSGSQTPTPPKSSLSSINSNNNLGNQNQSTSRGGGTISLPGSPPRSKDPIGTDEKSGAPIYCWGACGS